MSSSLWPSLRTELTDHSQISFTNISESEVTQLCPTLYNPMDCSQSGSSVYGIFQARILEWVAISFSRRSSWPRDWTRVSRIAGRRFTIWATREVQKQPAPPLGRNQTSNLRMTTRVRSTVLHSTRWAIEGWLELTGKIGLGIQNEAGLRLIEFCQENALVIANTLFQQHKWRLYTWASPDGQHQNQIDYILWSQRQRSSIQLAKMRLGTDYG